MSLFSSEVEDPDLRACHNAMEDLSYHAQGLLCLAMESGLNLSPAQLTKLTRCLREVDRRVQTWRRRLGAAQRRRK